MISCTLQQIVLRNRSCCQICRYRQVEQVDQYTGICTCMWEGRRNRYLYSNRSFGRHQPWLNTTLLPLVVSYIRYHRSLCNTNQHSLTCLPFSFKLQPRSSHRHCIYMYDNTRSLPQTSHDTSRVALNLPKVFSYL